MGPTKTSQPRPRIPSQSHHLSLGCTIGGARKSKRKSLLEGYKKAEADGRLSRQALERLLESRRQFLSFIQSRVESREVAGDILQAAFVRGIEKGGLLCNEETVVAWFYRLLRNASIDHYRQRGSSERAALRVARRAGSGGSAAGPAVARAPLDRRRACRDRSRQHRIHAVRIRPLAGSEITPRGGFEFGSDYTG
jgi:hypothetical protein